MGIKREFLGWKRSAVASAADYLFDRYESGGLVDLTLVTVVLPTRRAGRRLREVLLDLADKRELALFPPVITAVGSLPECLYTQQHPFATPLVQQLAWADALKKSPKATVAKIIPQPPEDKADPRWLELGAVLQRQHQEVTSHRLDFAGVAQHGKLLEGFTEVDRWTALSKVQKKYLKTLDALEVWDRQTARNFAVDHDECQIAGDVILIGAVDLTRTTRAMLDQIANQVTALVFAEPSWNTRFDDHGCVVPDAWQSAMIDVRNDQILVADGPANQADAVVHAIDGLDGKFSADDITIGVPDVSLVPHLENKLKQFRLNTRWGPGRLLTASRPAQWLRIAADYVTSDRYDALAELVRHDDTLQYLKGLNYRGNVVREMDNYFDQHLPDVIRSGKGNAGKLPDAILLLQDLLKPLRGKRKSPGAWGEAVHEVLVRLYYGRQLNVDVESERATLQACEKLNMVVDRLAELPKSITPNVSAAVAILMLLSQLDEDEVPPPAGNNVLEMVGWLDLPLDDAKVAIVTGMNDGVIPRSVSSDVFLPNALRQSLGLDDNAQRYARDAYALQVLLESRMAVRFVMGRRAASNDPLRPSRLLMATHRDKLADRCLRLFDGREVDFAPIVMPVDKEDLEFEVPRPAPLKTPIESLSVSDFGRYLNCPYRFYLQKVRRLKSRDDRLTEIDAPTFGDLAHQVVEAFGLSEFSDSSNANEIRLYLFEELARRADEKFGGHPKPTVQVQIAMLKQRLDVFADRQAEWREKGWQILRTEFSEDDGQLMVDGEPMRLKGRIDRIDHRVVEGEEQFAVLDYKTSDAGDPPAKKHVPGKKIGDPIEAQDWADLQLPLYRHLLKSMPEMKDKTDMRLGYILLPSDSTKTGFALANWREEALQTADEAAANIVRQIRAERFWPPADPYPYKNNDELAAIVQDRVFGRAPFVEEATVA